MKKLLIICLLAFWFVSKVEGEEDIIPSLVWIPPGTFLMGSPETEPFRRSREGPQTRVTLTRGFWMGKYEITFREYENIMGKDPWLRGLPTHPVHASWERASIYCEWLTKRERVASRLPPGYIYRLPTEAEWEYTCRAGTTTAFAYGDSLRSGMANFNGTEEYPPCDDGQDDRRCYNPNGINIRTTTPVGSYKPNAWGLYDMHGNVAEWCKSFYWSFPGGNVTNWDRQTPSAFGYIFRGGCRRFDAFECRSAFRYDAFNYSPFRLVGFRIVLAWDEKEWIDLSENIIPTSIRPTYGVGPEKLPGKNSHVVVTHGMNPDLKWVEEMTNAVTSYLAGTGQDNWQVHAHKWKEKADNTSVFSIISVAEEEGRYLGEMLVKQNWLSVHLIAHSAGAALIQTASTAIKNEVTHLTFLDPFTGFSGKRENVYGHGASWAENYFSRDLDTGIASYQTTEGSIDHAYNVDVTNLDPNKIKIGTFRPTLGAEPVPCYRTKTSHEWPHKFYLRTIVQSWEDAEGLGFPLSKEGGRWDFARSNYEVGNTEPKVLGEPDTPCFTVLEIPPPDFGPFFDFLSLPNSKSKTGTVDAPGSGRILIFKTGSPVWFAAAIEVTNSVNILNFESQFLDLPEAEGLLSVSWDGEIVGTIERRFAEEGNNTNLFGLPRVYTNGTHTLALRLDAYGVGQASVLITSVALGFAGPRVYSFGIIEIRKDGSPLFQMTGRSGFEYMVEASPDLFEWSPTAILGNTEGMVRFTDPTWAKSETRFYRISTP